ncbi:MAG: ATP-binding cassette domain-containing protein [Legionellales bacterium]|nr:ATP-binding cassette domain-containing protein [Legionellales bacterium]
MSITSFSVNILSIQGLNKTFGHTPVLTDINLVAKPGDVIVLVGSSGGGKSTLLRCINQLTQPDSGQIQLNDIMLDFPVTDKRQYQACVKQLRRRVGMVFQQFNLWPHMTVWQNLLEAPLRVWKRPKAQAMEEAEALLAKVGLVDKKEVYPGFLSGGQQQRIAIARALMGHPQVMLFDEPTSALDPEMSREVLQIMQQLANSQMTLIIVTHEMNFVRDIATHVAFLDRGALVEFGAADHLLVHPRTERLKKFLQSEHQT